jgi:flagellar basal body-associated protein FliL
LAEGGKGKGMMFLIAGLLILLIGLVVFLLITMLAMDRGGDGEQRVEFDVREVTLDQMVEYQPNGGPKTTNLLRGADGISRNARIDIVIMLYEGSTKDEIRHYEDLQARLRRTESAIWDLVIRTLRNTTYREATRPEAVEILKETILQALREMYQTNFIMDVNIIDFVAI